MVHADNLSVLGGQAHGIQQQSFPPAETHHAVTFDSASKSSDQQTVRTENSSSISSLDQLVSATYSPPKLSFDHDMNSSSHDHCKHDLSSISLTAKLNSYKYLDDYEYFHGERLKQNAMRKFGLIMQSVETRYKDCSESAHDNKISIGNLDREDDDDYNNDLDSDILGGPTSEFSNFNRILKRHRKRFRQNLTNLHHR